MLNSTYYSPMQFPSGHGFTVILLYNYLQNVATSNMDLGAGIFSTGSPELREGDLRLVGGQTQYEGRVEYFRDGLWSTICNDKWDLNDGQVVCRQLEFGAATSITMKADRFGEGQGFIALESVGCVGTETTLTDCEHGDWYINDCDHSQDAGVVCSTPEFENGDVRLVNGATNSEGRVEIFYNNTWGSICDKWWDKRDADVVCKELGFKEAEFAHIGAIFGQGVGPVWYDSVQCDGTEVRLEDCLKIGPGLSTSIQQRCQHFHDVGVTCKVINEFGYPFRTVVYLGFFAALCILCVVLNIPIKGRRCWTYFLNCSCKKIYMRDPHQNYPIDIEEAPSSQGYTPRPDDILDRDSIMRPPPPSYDIATDERYSCESRLAVLSLRTNSDSGVFRDDESIPSSPPPSYDSVSEYSRCVLSAMHGTSNQSLNITSSCTPFTISRCPSPFTTTHSSPFASPQRSHASPGIWSRSSYGLPNVSSSATSESGLYPPPPYSETDPEESINRNECTMPRVE